MSLKIIYIFDIILSHISYMFIVFFVNYENMIADIYLKDQINSQSSS